MPLLLLAWVICAPAFLKCFKVFPLCEFSGNTHYLPGCHNTVFADWVTSALVIQKPLFSEQIATENDNGLLQTGENKTVFPYGLVMRVCKMSRRHTWGSNPNSEWGFREERGSRKCRRDWMYLYGTSSNSLSHIWAYSSLQHAWICRLREWETGSGDWNTLSGVALHSQSAGPAIDIIKCRVLNNYYCALNTPSPSGRLGTHGTLTGWSRFGAGRGIRTF